MDVFDRYNRYEEEFNNSLNIVLSYQLHAKNNEVKELTQESIEAEVELFEAEGFLKAMEFESLNFHQNRTKNLVKCRDKFDLAVKLVNKLKACAESARRDDLKKQTKWFTLGKSSITKTASLTDLEESLGTIKETEQIGYDILSGLSDDRDALLKARFHVIETNRSTSEAGGVLVLIGRRVNVQVMLLILLISALFVIIFLLIYCKLAKKNY